MSLTYDQLFPGRFIKAGEMDGKSVTLTIADVYLDHIEGEDGREKPQAVVAFRETKREWALNRTNGICLRALFGDQTDDWVGRRVTLYPERDTSGLSDSGVCLRVLGAPHLTEALTVEVKLPRRKPQKRTLKPTGKSGSKSTTSGETDYWPEDAPETPQDARSGDAANEGSDPYEASSDGSGEKPSIETETDDAPGMDADELKAKRETWKRPKKAQEGLL